MADVDAVVFLPDDDIQHPVGRLVNVVVEASEPRPVPADEVNHVLVMAAQNAMEVGCPNAKPFSSTRGGG